MNEPNSSTPAEPISPQVPIGGRSAIVTPEKASVTPVTNKASVSTGSSDTTEVVNPAPSVLEGTKTPFLARQLKIESDILRSEGLLPKVQEVDAYIIALIKERQWVDTEESYQTILKEISKSLGLNEHLDLFARIDKLLLGTRLIKEQRRHEKLARQFKDDLEKIKT